jgi:hypothetical protein
VLFRSTLSANSAGSNGTAIGAFAMQYYNDSSSPFVNNNVALGYSALQGSNTPSANTGIQRGVVYGNGVFVAVGAAGSVQSSTDGTTWTNRTTANTSLQAGVVYDNGVFVSVGTSGAIQTSTDGTTWTNRTTANTNNQLGVAYGNGVFVSVGTGGAIQTSTDGTTWTNRNSIITIDSDAVAYGNGIFVTVVNNSPNQKNIVKKSKFFNGLKFIFYSVRIFREIFFSDI